MFRRRNDHASHRNPATHPSSRRIFHRSPAFERGRRNQNPTHAVVRLPLRLRRIAEDRAKEMTEAYSVLSDISKRRQYDRLIAEHRQQSSPAQPPPPRQSASQTPPGPFCTKCGTPLHTSGLCPRCDKSRKAANTPSPQPATSRSAYNWDPLKRWAGQHPLLILSLAIFTSLFVVSLLSDSSTPTSSQTKTAVTTNSTPAPGGPYSAYPCDAKQTVSPVDQKPCKALGP